MLGVHTASIVVRWRATHIAGWAWLAGPGSRWLGLMSDTHEEGLSCAAVIIITIYV